MAEFCIKKERAHTLAGHAHLAVNLKLEILIICGFLCEAELERAPPSLLDDERLP